MSDYHKLRYNIAYVFLIISVLSVSCDLVPEFQFPCYVDVCTFPRQYCNSDRNERRCSPCTRSLCKQQELPRACLYFCQVADQPLTTTLSTQTSADQQKKLQDKSSVYQAYMVIYIAVTNTVSLALVVFIILWRIRFYAKKGKPPLSPMERFISGVDEERPLLENRCKKTELCRLESLPPYTSKEPQVVNLEEGAPKIKTEGTGSECDNQSFSLNSSQRSSSATLNKPIKCAEDESDAGRPGFSRFVSNPTVDKKHEYHEKPWSLGAGGNTESTESEAEVEETRLKQ